MSLPPFIYILAAVWFLYNQILAYRRAQASHNWPQTKGHVTVAQRQLFGIDDYANLTGARIIYEYNVQKAKYTSHTVAFSPKFARPHQLITKYRAGKNVIVFYDPKNPEIAVLEAGPKRSNYVMLLAGGLFFVLAALNLIFQPI